MRTRSKWMAPLLGALLLFITVGVLVPVADERVPASPATQPPADRVGNSPAITVCRQQGINGYFDAQDTDIFAYNPTLTNGWDSSLRITSNNTRNFLIQFVLPTLPHDITVSEAILRLRVTYPSTPTFPMDVDLYRVRRMWTDQHASWTYATEGIPWGLPGCNDPGTDRHANPIDGQIVSEPNSWVEFRITEDVIDWLANPSLNHGYIARGQGEHTVQYNFASGEHPQDYQRPELCITYYEATPTPTITQTPTETATPTPSATATRTPTATLTPTRTTGDIHGMVWHDENGNGRREHEEPPLPNAQIVLRTAAGALMMLSTTGGDGLYELAEIVPGNYWLQEVDPPGYVSTTINDWMVPVLANTTIEINFGDRHAPTPTATHTGTPTTTPTPTLVPCRDFYEPDDQPLDAKAISTDGVVQRRNIHQAGDRDYVKFSAAAGHTYVLKTLNLGGGVANDTRLTLLAPDGTTVLAINDDSPTDPPASRIEWICPDSGTYFMLVSEYNPAVGGCDITYDLSAARIEPTAVPTVTRTPTATRAPHINVLPFIVRG